LNRDLEAIFEVIDHTPESRLKRDRLKKVILKTFKKTGRLETNWFPPDFRWNLCAARMRRGHFDNYDGWHFRSDWSCTFHETNGYKNPLPKWDGSAVEHLVVLGEQGIGDEILFASAIPELIVRLGSKAVEFQCHPRLQRIIERSFGIRVADRKNLSSITEGDAIVALADLFMFYRRDKSHFPRKPFFRLDEERVKYWKGVLDEISDKPKIGIAWKARHGSLNPEDLMFEDATYINLQYGESCEAAREVGIDPLEDIEDHINLIAALDKVVSVTQTVIHEAGCIGKECHAIRPLKDTGEVDNVLWYYGNGNIDSPVYGSVKIWNTIGDYQRWLK